MALPALRNIDVSPVQHEGQNLICIFDPEGYVEEQIVLTPAAFFVAISLDGKNDVLDIQAAFARQFRGTILPSDDLMQIVTQLDSLGFLESETFYAKRRAIEDAFARADARAAYGAGRSYASDADELRAFLDGLFTREKGPGMLPPSASGGIPLRGIVAPHIDFPRGGHAYAHAYLELARHGRPKTVILFGVAHSSPPVPFVLTRKGFDTPFGVVKTNIEFVDRLAQACAWNPFEDELVHRTEHSIEFQAVMLAYLYGPDIEIVPILCGQFTDDPFLTDAAELSEVTAFLDVCRELAAPPESRVTVIAGADLAHVGKRFGDPFDITDGIVGQVGGRDRQDLEHVTRLEPEAFYRSVMRDHNQRKVCGHGAIYSLLKTVQGSAQSARLLCYDYAPDPAGGIVSFASIALI